MISAYRQIRLTNSLLSVTGAANDRLQVGSRSVVYTDETGNFGAGGINVSSLNTLTGALTASGYGNITVTNDGVNIVRISGDTGAYANFASVTNLASTGSNLQTQITNSGNSFAVWTGKFQSFNSGITPTGSDSYFIGFPLNFSAIPRVVATLEVTGSTLYSIAVQGRSTSGYYCLFSDLVAESGVSVNTIATLN